MNRMKCSACGVVNFANSETCRRCGAELLSDAPELKPAAGPVEEGRSFGRWVLWILGVTAAILISFYASLLFSSQGLSIAERQIVMNAIGALEREARRFLIG
jgi:hypothetical protein